MAGDSRVVLLYAIAVPMAQLPCAFSVPIARKAKLTSGIIGAIRSWKCTLWPNTSWRWDRRYALDPRSHTSKCGPSTSICVFLVPAMVFL
eukprot:2832816-Rhodomonas_salina.1